MREQRERRERMIGVKVTAEEYERFRVLAFEARKSLGAFIRERVLGGDAPKAKRQK
jgi:hypothetical protein